MEIITRELTKESIPSLVKLEKICITNSNDLKMLGVDISSDYSKFFKEGAKAFGLLNGSELIASAMLQAYSSEGDKVDFDKGMVSVLNNSMVHPLFRGNGFQKLLILNRVEYSLERGYDMIESLINSENLYSIRNLESTGFKNHGVYGSNDKAQFLRYVFEGL